MNVNAMTLGAAYAINMRYRGLYCLLFAGFLLSGCSALPDKPVRAAL